MEFLTEFNKTKSVDKQKEDTQRLRTKYPNRIPVLVDRLNRHINKLERNKFLVPYDLTLSQFILTLRTHVKLTPDQAIFVFRDDHSLAPMATLMCELYKNHATAGGYLVLLYSGESTFG